MCDTEKYNNICDDNNKNTNIELNYKNINIDIMTMHKMFFIYSALNKGWNIKKKDDFYIFKKKHSNNEEIFTDKYLSDFINENIIV